MGEALHEVDFQQLKIENEQYLEKIDEKNTELMDLKLKASKSLQVLNSYKVSLGESKSLRKSSLQFRQCNQGKSSTLL